jgi:hypothetical protein
MSNINGFKTYGTLARFEKYSNFWEINPNYRIVPEFNELWKKDRSENKNQSSKKMWYIAFMNDISVDNTMRNIPQVERKAILLEELGIDEINEAELTLAIKRYIELGETPAIKALKAWNDKIEERAKFLSETSYSLDNAETLDKLLSNTPKIYGDYQRVLKELTQEGGDSNGKGGYSNPSILDE